MVYRSHVKPGSEVSRRRHMLYSKERLCSELDRSLAGVNGRSILNLSSSPVDIMHSLFENAVPAMFRHWSGTFFKNNEDFDSDYLPSSVWVKIGEIMQSNQKNMPLEFGRPPINIQRHSSAFKAEDWSNWAQLYFTKLPSRKVSLHAVVVGLQRF